MQQTQSAPLSGDVDPEVFRRVWSRVMADEESSPIAVEPEQKTSASAVPEARPQEREEMPEPAETPAPGDGALLEQGLSGMGRGLALARVLSRKSGGRGTALAALTADYRRAARQLGAAYFLATGKQKLWDSPTVPAGTGLAQGLRELYWWERDWSRQCLRAAEQAQDDYVQQLFQRLSQTGQIHLGIIRGALEQMQAPGLDGGRARGVN